MYVTPVRLRLVVKNQSNGIDHIISNGINHINTTGHNIKWDHFEILASGKNDLHCKLRILYSFKIYNLH